MPHSQNSPGYAELVCTSNFTFLHGASHPQELVARAAKLGYDAIALTDECSLAGAVRAFEEARRCTQQGTPIKLICGSLFTLEGGSRLVLLATDKTGYTQLCGLVTRGRRQAPKGRYELPDQAFENGLEHCLALWLPATHNHSTETDMLLAHWVVSHFPGRSWLAVSRDLGFDDGKRLARLLGIGKTVGLPVTACGDVQMHIRSRRMLHDVLAAIRHGCTVAELGYRALPSGERHLRGRQYLAALYRKELLEESVHIARRCQFRLEALHYQYPHEVVPRGVSSTAYLRKLTEAGIRQRWPEGIGKQLRQQIEKELGLISELQYESYFLTVHDIVQFARSRDILCQGRGSAANSAVCYCLGITEVDPARMNMLFERFISRERDEPPDIDVDFEHERREEVIQYIYKKYGRERAALAATVIRYRPRSAIRDAGKALGFSPEQVDLLARNVSWWDKPEDFARRLAEQGFAMHQLKVRQLLYLVQNLAGFPRHLSQHVGGFVISENSLASLVPVENAAMDRRTVIQWDKDDLETLGLLKVDCLALGMLTAIHRCLDLINNYRAGAESARGLVGVLPGGTVHGKEDAYEPTGQELFPAIPCISSIPGGQMYSRHVPQGTDPDRPIEPLTIADIPPEDPATYQMIQNADTIGVFQIESRAQMAMLPRLKPACFYDLVIQVAIVRPGPIQGNMVHPYLQRRRGLEAVVYPSEALQKVLQRTLGVPIFQEQVMQIAMVAAGFSGSEADQLRRSMAAWARRGDMGHMRQRLVDGMLERGYPHDFAMQVFEQIKGFGEYGFPESHAASFALLAYVSAWLKRHHPAAFACALLNSQPMGFYQPAQLVQDARRHGVTVLPADVRYSDWDCALEPDTENKPQLRLGLRLVKGLGKPAAERISAARVDNPFSSAQDLTTRARLNRRELAVLAAAAALRGVAGHRHRAYWEVAASEKQPADLLLGIGRKNDDAAIRPASEADDLMADYAATGLTLGRHPLALVRGTLQRRRIKTARQLLELQHGTHARACGLVTMRQRPMTANGTIFLTLEDETGHVNVVVWQRLWERQRNIVLKASLIAVDGVMESDGEVYHLIARQVHDYGHLLAGLQTRSRNFC